MTPDIKKILLCFVSKVIKNVGERVLPSGFDSSRNNRDSNLHNFHVASEVWLVHAIESNKNGARL